MTPSPAEPAIDRPTIALAMGDPAGVSPELTARLLADDEVRQAARIVVFGDRRILDEGAKVARVALDIDVVARGAPPGPRRAPGAGRPRAPRAGRRPARRGHARGRRLRHRELPPGPGDGAVRAGRRRVLHAVQQAGDALRLPGLRRRDRLRFRRPSAFTVPRREFNILEGLWNARVTSHIPLAQVAATITTERILAELALTDQRAAQRGLRAATHRRRRAQSARRRRRQLRHARRSRSSRRR